MKTLALVGLFGVGLFAIWKHHVQATAVKTPATDIPSGVSAYPSTPAANYPSQILAAAITNSNAVSEPGYSPAFGQYENQGTDEEELY